MQLCKAQTGTGEVRVGVVADNHVRFLDLEDYVGMRTLSDILHSDNPAGVAHDLIDDRARNVPLMDVTLLPPVDRQEVWAAGVTYKRSRQAREHESAEAGASSFYDRVYSADRPELFFKANPHRVVGSGDRLRVRRDSRWSVPEPELALVLTPRLELVGYTIGNDMSARDIEGENPLYLPQAKIYDRCCALGPVITLAQAMPPLSQVAIRLTIQRGGDKVFEGATNVAEMARPVEELIGWLGRDNSFPHGVILLTGTGIVPPDDFALLADDLIAIEIAGIGRLVNRVEQGG
jgi:2-dehydro-3-deoxy-D-arabinonate dehydratase